MIKFIGTYSARIDDRGRLVFPVSFKNLLEGGDCRLVVKKDLFAPCLNLFTSELWSEASDKIRNSLNFFNPKHSLFWRCYMNGRAVVEPDAKFGRINIPGQMLEEIAVNKEVLFIGCDHKVELWAKERWEAENLLNGDYTTLASEIFGNR